jgi:hypothetical protein
MSPSHTDDRSHAAGRILARLFRHRSIADLDQIKAALGTRSHMTVFRRLSSLGYLSSYTHAGRYYTLVSIPAFDDDGLWRYQGVGFSRHGTLKNTVLHLVESSEAGRTQHELQLRLQVRVHNPLLDLVKARRLGRERLDREYVYVAAARARAAEQIDRRRALGVAGAISAPPMAALDIEVLVEVIHGVRVPPPAPATVAARLRARGVAVTPVQVEQVLARHGVVKKTPRSRSRRSRR